MVWAFIKVISAVLEHHIGLNCIKKTLTEIVSAFFKTCNYIYESYYLL